MGRKQLYTSEQLKRYVMEYVESLSSPTIITAGNVAAFINEQYHFSSPLKYWHFTRRPEVMEIVDAYNSRLGDSVSLQDETDSVIQDQSIDFERILKVRGDETALRRELADIDRRISDLSSLVHKHQRRELELERKVAILEDRAENAERKHAPDPKELKESIRKYKKRAAETKRYMEEYISAGIKTSLIADGRLDDDGSKTVSLPVEMAAARDDIRSAVERYAEVMGDAWTDDDPFVIEGTEEEEKVTAVYSSETSQLMNDLDEL